MPGVATGFENPEAIAAAKAGSAARNGGIDALRAATTLLVVLHHAAIAYGAIGGWYYKEIAPSQTLQSELLVLFCTLNQAWFMGLFFLLAGYYTPSAFERHGAARFALERLRRLGIPLLVYFFLLSPLTNALAATARGRPFWRVFVYQWTDQGLEPGPLWFAWALLIFAAIYIAWRAPRPATPQFARPAFPSNRALLAAALATGAAAFALRLVWPVGVNVFALQLGYFPGYVVLFVAGCLAARGKRLKSIPADQARLWRRIAWCAFPVFPVVAILSRNIEFLQGRAEGGWNMQALTYAFWEPFVAWGFILGLVSAFQRRFTILNAAWSSLARRAFLIYIIHPPVLVATALVWRSVAAPALLKFIVTGSLACAICYVVAGLLLRVPGVARVV